MEAERESGFVDIVIVDEPLLLDQGELNGVRCVGGFGDSEEGESGEVVVNRGFELVECCEALSCSE